MIIEIKGVQFVNKGAELMLEAIFSKLKAELPEAKIALQPGVHSPYEKRAMLGAYQRIQLRKNRVDLNGLSYFLPKIVRRFLLRFGIVTEADIDVILDASGFTYGDKWPFLMHYHVASEAKRLKRKGKKFIFLPQAFGPFTNTHYKEQIKQAVDAATLIFARDKESFSTLKQTAPQANIFQSPDFTNLLTATHTESDEQYSNSVCLIPNSKMLSNKNVKAGWHERYMAFWGDVISVVKDAGYDVFLLNHEGKKDQAICEEIVRLFGDEILIVNELSPTRVKGLIAASAFSVCSRFHGCVSGLSQGKIVFGTSWAHKYEQLYRDYNAETLLLSPSDDKDSIKLKIDSLVTSETEQELLASSEVWKESAREMWTKVFQTMNG